MPGANFKNKSGQKKKRSISYKIHLDICNQFSEIIISNRYELGTRQCRSSLWERNIVLCHFPLISLPPQPREHLETGWIELSEADTFSQRPVYPQLQFTACSKVLSAFQHLRLGGKGPADKNCFPPTWGDAIHARFPAQRLITRKTE